jgi:hypothetical protein
MTFVRMAMTIPFSRQIGAPCFKMFGQRLCFVGSVLIVVRVERATSA